MISPSSGCCEGVRKLTPAGTANRPGLSAIFYRVGTHSAFLETMKAGLSNLPLRTRDASDFSIALLDAWAMVADVLTFYQERIANEGYLRTATERRSILELARLIGYELRPGVASTVYLAYTIEKDSAVDVPAGSRAQSIPGPGELPQSFETSAPLLARGAWNNLKPRQTQPQRLKPGTGVIYLNGIATNLKPNQRLLFDFGSTQVPRRVLTVEPDNDNNRTKVTLETAPQSGIVTPGTPLNLLQTIESLTQPLVKPPAAHPASPLQLPRDVNTAFGPASDLLPRLAAALRPGLDLPQLYTAMQNPDPVAPEVAVYAFQTRASAFGHNAPKKPVFGKANLILDPIEWPLSRVARGSSETVGFAVLAVRNSVANVASNLAAAPPGWVLSTAVILVATTMHDDNRPVESGAAFTIPLPAANDAISVKFTESNGAINLTYTFQNRSLSFVIDADPSGKVRVTSKGTNPTDTTVSASQDPTKVTVDIRATAPTASSTQRTEQVDRISLDTVYDKIVPGGWILLEGAMTQSTLVGRVAGAAERSRADYGIAGKVTEVTLPAGKPWLDFGKEPDLSAIREVAVFAQSERLELAEEPIEEPLCGERVELDGLYDGLESGRWLIVSGERAGVFAGKVPAAELVMLAGVEQDTRDGVPGDKLHTFLTLASGGLAYCYKRGTIAINGNVAPATHGETRAQVLGNGDASQALPEFPLLQYPLTYVSAPTPSGVESTLQVRVNGILWREAPGLAFLGPADRAYLTRTGDDSKTTVIFGNGIRGARVPTGVENLGAVYRNGIGKPGNVKAGQITLLATKPLGVKDVINPIRASGGADRDSRDDARRNAPLAVMSLDRLVSVEDYANFARTFAGVGKASSMLAGLHHTSIVHVTIAGAGNSPIDESSALFVNLLTAFAKFGDPQQPVRLAVRELMLLVIAAKVAILPDYLFDNVAPKIRAALLDAFSFDGRDLAEDVLQSEVIATIQNVEGVQYADLDTLDTIPEDMSRLPAAGNLAVRIPVKPARVDSSGGILPAQLAFLSPDLPETLILTELKNA